MEHNQQLIDDARRLLYNFNPVDGSIAGKSKLYEMYEENAKAYAKAKSDYDLAMEKARSDPLALQAWPMTGMTYRQSIDSAWDRWTSAGKDRIERALTLIGSQSKVH